MIDFIDLTWFDSIVLFAILLGLVIWFPIYRSRKGRKGRGAHPDQK